MGKLKPLIASLVTIAIAMAILFGWSLLRDEKPRRNAPAENAPANAPTGELVYEEVALDQRPQRDPAYLWPQTGQRMSSARFWVLWKTDDFCDCRLLATKDQHLWYEVGHTGGDTHYLLLDLAMFDSSLTFAVDFTHEGQKYRSKPRHVTFGRGIHFAERQYNFKVAPQRDQQYSLFLRGRDPIKVPGTGFRHGWFTGDMVVYYSPQPGDEKGGEMIFGVQEGARVPADGCAGFVEVYDEIGDSRDRVLIHLKP